ARRRPRPARHHGPCNADALVRELATTAPEFNVAAAGALARHATTDRVARTPSSASLLPRLPSSVLRRPAPSPGTPPRTVWRGRPRPRACYHGSRVQCCGGRRPRPARHHGPCGADALVRELATTAPEFNVAAAGALARHATSHDFPGYRDLAGELALPGNSS